VEESGSKWHEVAIEEAKQRMFYGENQHSIDPKGRVIIPMKYRHKLGNAFMITRGLEKCLFVYSPEEWEKVVESLGTLNSAEKNARDVTRFFFNNAEECELDSQGRVLVPQNLREYAGLAKDVYINGVKNRVEIWDKKIYEDYKDESTFESIAAKIETHQINL
jgi:MraZ protein